MGHIKSYAKYTPGLDLVPTIAKDVEYDGYYEPREKPRKRKRTDSLEFDEFVKGLDLDDDLDVFKGTKYESNNFAKGIPYDDEIDEPKPFELKKSVSERYTVDPGHSKPNSEPWSYKKNKLQNSEFSDLFNNTSYKDDKPKKPQRRNMSDKSTFLDEYMGSRKSTPGYGYAKPSKSKVDLINIPVVEKKSGGNLGFIIAGLGIVGILVLTALI